MDLAQVWHVVCANHEEWSVRLRKCSAKRIFTGASMTSMEGVNNSSKIFIPQVSL